MYQPLVPCDRCTRHVRVDDPRCPFCGHDVTDAMRAKTPAPLPPIQLSRAGALALAAAMTIAGCKEESSPEISKDSAKTKTSSTASQKDPDRPAKPDTGLVDDNGAAVTKYGGPPMPAPSPVPPPTAAVPAYGAPPPMPTPIPTAKPK